MMRALPVYRLPRHEDWHRAGWGSLGFPSLLPARFLNARDQAGTGQVAEADAANAELAIHRSCPAAQLAAALDPNLFAGKHLDFVGSLPAGVQFRHLPTEFDVLCFGSHGLS